MPTKCQDRVGEQMLHKVEATSFAAMGGRGGGCGIGGASGGVVSHVGFPVTPTLALSAVVSSMPIAVIGGSKIRRNDKNTPDKTSSDDSESNSLGERAPSKLTLDDELFDILYAFGTRQGELEDSRRRQIFLKMCAEEHFEENGAAEMFLT
ncbi:unnamed protein product [Angiostrongylus costaricensis]|uniref:Uncharacterized protein n=1 Tax=Angiostrongylus costaricensis TaxID=334426 RepID=A0A0R3PC79_ANGCS|nr:unnamed protein product [Angiostrongylus costaricensis]